MLLRDSQDVSVYCYYYHGYMGGENLLTYTTGCDINLSGTETVMVQVTFTVSSFSNVNPRTVELSKRQDNPSFSHLKILKNISLSLSVVVRCLPVVVLVALLLVLMIEDIMVAGVVKFIMSINLQNLSLRIIMERVAI